MDFEVVADGTRRGSKIWVANGFEYVSNRIRGDITYLRCRLKRNHNCHGVAKFISSTNKFYVTNGDHRCHYFDHLNPL